MPPPSFLRALAVLALGLLATACSSLPRVPASGRVDGQRLETTVDSLTAKYYLENYLAGQRTQPKLDAEFRQLDQQTTGSLPSSNQLQLLSKQYSVDTVAIYYAQRLLQDQKNQEVQTQFEHEVTLLQSDAPHPAPVSASPEQNYIVIFIPGWLYRSKPWTGADFARPRALLTQMGIENHLIETKDNGTVEDNAAIVARSLRPYLQMNRPIIVISGSKGGPEAAMALGNLLDLVETQSIKAWINMCGSIQGSPLSDYWLSWPNRIVPIIVWWFNGWGNLEGLASLDTARSRKRADQVHIPPHVFVLNYIGVPVSGTIRDTTKGFTYGKLRAFGPNDGLVLIPDEIQPGGPTVIELGRGHLLKDDDMDVRTVALLRTVIKRVETKDGTSPPVATVAAPAN